MRNLSILLMIVILPLTAFSWTHEPVGQGSIRDYQCSEDGQTAFCVTLGEGLWRSLDGGTTWESLNSLLFPPDGGYSDRRVFGLEVVDPEASTVLVGIYSGHSNGLWQLMKSHDSGDSWEAFDYPGSSYSNSNILTVSEHSQDRWFYQSHAGLYVSENEGDSWSSLYESENLDDVYEFSEDKYHQGNLFLIENIRCRGEHFPEDSLWVILMSEDSGETWNPIHELDQEDYPNSIFFNSRTAFK